jgi:hypothetical protein
MSEPTNPFDKPPTYHININAGRTTDEMVAELRKLYPPAAPALRERISTLEALTDQLLEALRAAVTPHAPGCRFYGVDQVCSCTTQDALRAYEADKEAHR